MQAQHRLRIGYFGKIPRRRGFVGDGLSEMFCDRWDRWVGMTPQGVAPTDQTLRPARPIVWRFIAGPGLFSEESASGAWCISRDAQDQVYPLVIAGLGPPPPPIDRWFLDVADLVARAASGALNAPGLNAACAALPPPDDPGPYLLKSPALVWRDDWEVHEYAFPDGRALASHGLPGGLVPLAAGSAT